MSWLVPLGLALAAFAGIAFVLKAPRKGWEAIGSALLLGIAGYALQGSPGLSGAPKLPAQSLVQGGAEMVAARQELGTPMGSGSNLVMIADGMTRNGQFGTAAGLLRAAVAKNPADAEAWLALANALTGHAEGNLSPAAIVAYRRAAEAAPDHPGPPFFLGMALARNGRLTEARGLWAELLARSPKDAPWRADLEQRLAELDGFIAQQQAGGTVR